MKFDWIIGNPPFTLPSTGNIAGTGGNTVLYKTITKNLLPFLNTNGSLLFITLKGIIKDLNLEISSNYNVKFIDLMDQYNFWDFNTCIFKIENSGPTPKEISIFGGWCKNVFSIIDDEHFEYVYYPASDSGMSHCFTKKGKNKVIRKLPGRQNDLCIYDYTNKSIDRGPKLAFTVLESSKSYTVTDEPVIGGTICYIKTKTILEAKKLEKFLRNSVVFKNYIKRMKFREYAFQLRNVKAFDINQIKTGNEIPKEWNLKLSDITSTAKNNYEINKKDLLRVKQNSEFFTPKELCDIVLSYIPPETWIDPTKTFLEPSCGNGNFLVALKERLLKHNHSEENILSRLYAVDIMQDNVDETKDRLDPNKQFRDIVDKNIVCADALEYHYRFDNTPCDPTQEEIFDDWFEFID